MFIEFMQSHNDPVLINTKEIVSVTTCRLQSSMGVVIGSQIILRGTRSSAIRYTVLESFEEVKKRLGMSIIPRAETIAIPGGACGN